MAKVLVYGSGGRDHCLADKYGDSQHVEKVYFMPGNPGVLYTPKGERGLIELVKNANPDDFGEVAAFCRILHFSHSLDYGYAHISDWQAFLKLKK